MVSVVRNFNLFGDFPMVKGLRILHVCDCGTKRMISKVVMARRNGTRCTQCGRNMSPTEAGWEKLATAQSAKQHGIKEWEDSK